MNHFRPLVYAILAVLCFLPAGAASSKKPKKTAKASFDYYMLVLSYAPDFCAESAAKSSGTQMKAAAAAKTRQFISNPRSAS